MHRTARGHIISCVSILAFTLNCSLISSQPIKRLSQVEYNVNQGLLQSHIYDISEDGNGIIWISSGGGVQRFDGREFYHVPVAPGNKGIPDDRFVRFFQLKNGNLWLHHEKGTTEYDISSNRFKAIRYASSEAQTPAFAFSEEDDAVWFWVVQKGYYKLSKKTLQFTDSIKSDYQALFDITNDIPVSTSLFFIQQSVGELMVTDRESRKAYIIKNPETIGRFFDVEIISPGTALIATSKGIALLDCEQGSLTLLQPYKTQPDIVNVLHPVQIRKVSATAALVSEANKLFEFDITRGTYSSMLSNLQNEDFIGVGYITGLFNDSHQNAWVISENDGIRKLNYGLGSFRYFGTSSRKSNYVKAIYANKTDNRVLCGTFEEGLLIFDTSQHLLKKIRTFSGIEGPLTICGFIRSSPHHYLVIAMGTWDIYEVNTQDFSVNRIPTNTDQIKSQVKDLLFPDYHLGLFTLDDSTCIIQTGYFVNKLVWRQPSKVMIYPVTRLAYASVSSTLTVDKILWIGSYGRYYVSDAGFHRFREIILPENKLVRCFASNRNGQMWMGTEKGLHMLDSSGSTIRIIGKAEGLPDENIYAMQFDAENNLWLSHNKGITCRKVDGSFLHFSKSDGLQENEFNTSTSFVSRDGELFFGGVNGISSFFPSMITGAKEKPQVIVTGIKVKDVPWKADTAYWSIRTIVLPYNNNNISFDLTAIGNRSPDQYNYQYQLVGEDEQWINAGNNSHARFSLQPGKYVFRYYAGNSFESNPKDVKEISVIIEAPFWKTAWFITAMLLLVGTSTILITRHISQLRLKRKVEELERRKVLYEERIRISREMHDDIGAGLTQITLMSERLKTKATDEEPLNEIAEASRKLVGNMSEIIWSINPENTSLEQLLAYLREQLNKLLEYSGIDYEIRFPEVDREIQLTTSQRRNLLLVTKEIVHNAVKHSKAHNILVECFLREKQLHFVISDDGEGFNTSAKSRGNGLRNIRRRIEELNGTIEISSSENAGSQFSYGITLV